MRPILLATALLTAACTGDTVHLAHHSTLVNATRGVVLLGNGEGHGAMLDTTCVFDGDAGFVFADVDLPTPAERITGQLDGELVVGISDEGIHPILLGERRPELEIAMPGVLDAKPTRVGVIWLRTDDTGCFVGARGGTERAVGPCTDAARLVVSPAGGARYLHDDGLLVDIATGEAKAADHAVWDRSGFGGLLIANGPTVTRHDADGAIDWTVEVDGGVASLSDLGARGGAAVVTRTGDLQLHDAGGARIAIARLPGGADVVVDDDGRDLSLVTPSETHNYTIEEGSSSRVNLEPPTLFAD
jgi:hypothetical protein